MRARRGAQGDCAANMCLNSMVSPVTGLGGNGDYSAAWKCMDLACPQCKTTPVREQHW